MAIVFRSVVVGSLVFLLGCATRPASQRSCATSTLVGTVIDLAGSPLSGAQVQLLEPESVGAITGLDGRFTINRVPCSASAAVAVSLLGYRRAIHPVTLHSDTVRVEIQLAVSQVAISGGEFPAPGPRIGLEAWRLLPDVIQSRAFLERLAEIQPSGGVTVWVPWYPDRADTTVIAAGRTLRLRSYCPECAESPYRTVEGGARYRVGSEHVRIGAANLVGARQTLLFCIDLHRTGMEAALNCSSETGDNTIVFEYRLDGAWFRTR